MTCIFEVENDVIIFDLKSNGGTFHFKNASYMTYHKNYGNLENAEYGVFSSNTTVLNIL